MAGDALSTIEDALLRGVVDAKIEITRRFPSGKVPIYPKRWREFSRLLRKQRLYDQALTAVDQLRKQPVTLPHDPGQPQDRAAQAQPRTNGGAHHDAAIPVSF